jgi:type IV secretory pathway VirB9-like protein
MRYWLSLLLLLCVSSASAQEYEDLIDQEIQQEKPQDLTPNIDYDVNMNRVMKGFRGHKGATNSVLNHVYNPNSTTSVRLRKYTSTTIILPKGAKRIEQIVIGDRTGFQVHPFGEEFPYAVVVDALEYEIDTSLTLIDALGRVYSFYLKSEAKESRHVPHFVVRISMEETGGGLAYWAEGEWHESNPPTSPTENRTLPDTTKLTADAKRYYTKLTKREYDFIRTLEETGIVNTDYKMYGERAIAPNAVWDDGNQTYISFQGGTPSHRIPQVYRVVDGYGSITNAHFKDGFLIIDSISDEGWMLIDGEKVVCIKTPKKRQAIDRSISEQDKLSNNASM